MRINSGWWLVGLLGAASACSRSPDATRASPSAEIQPEPSPSAPAASRLPLLAQAVSHAEVSGAIGPLSMTLSYGRASWSNSGYGKSIKRPAIELVFTAAPLACGVESPEKEPQVRFYLPPGPSAQGYAGGVIGLAADVTTPTAYHDFGSGAATLQIVRPEAPGEGLIQGSLAIAGKVPYSEEKATLAGTFSLPLCPGAPEPRPAGIPPTAPPEAPAFKNVLAMLNKETATYELWFFLDRPGRCGARTDTASFFAVAGIAAPRQGLLGPQPAELRYHPPVPPGTVTGGSAFVQGEAAILWDDKKSGGSLRGQVMTADGPHGPFTATLCR